MEPCCTYNKVVTRGLLPELRTMSRQKKCSLCKKSHDDRPRFFELVWKCDLILNTTLWQGCLCIDCQEIIQQLMSETLEGMDG